MTIYPNSLNKTAPVILICLAAGLCTYAMLIISSASATLLEWHLLTLNSTPIKINLILDPAGLFYSSVVLFISANVIQFSKFYMVNDPFINRFTVLVILFIISINLLIFIPHFIILLIGWDGLGITSFILVIYYQNPKSLAAGIITALINRIGDVIILIAIALTLNQGHWSIIHIWETPFIYPQIIAITLAAITKRAQMPFSRWLPAAIAAPTPVSALVHSSTLVTAGVFLLIRFYPFLSTLPVFHFFLLFFAVRTILMAGIRARTECDIKKIIALSTLRQLGMIITSLGLGMPTIALFHIITHALFKALLFICAGEVIALHGHGQDLRWLGNLTSQIPVASSCILIANSALCGLPFMAGFYSKDLIMELILVNNYNILIIILSFVAVGFTSFYTARFRLVILWCPRCFSPLHNIQENNLTVAPIIYISFISVVGGRLILWVLPETNLPSLLPTYLKTLPLITVLTGFILGWSTSSLKSRKQRSSTTWHIINYASCLIWFLVPLASQFQLGGPLRSGHHALKSVDHGWLELTGGQGVNIMTGHFRSDILRRTGKASPNALLLKCVAGGLSSLFLWALINCRDSLI